MRPSTWVMVLALAAGLLAGACSSNDHSGPQTKTLVEGIQEELAKQPK